MITIARLQTKNWKCYRGEVDLALEPQAYAIFAREVGNDARSNFCGKTSIVEAIDFALYGRLAKEFKNKKKGWISKGEKSGEVALTLSDGSVIKRSQSLSASERVWYFPPGSPEKGAVQEDAEKAIRALVGLTEEDFAATRYFRQGEMSRLVTLDPGPRLDLVAGWLRLQSVQDCEDDAAEALRELARRRDEAAAEAVAREIAEAEAWRRAGVEDDGQAVVAILAAQHCAALAQQKIDVAQKALDEDRDRAAIVTAAETYERTVEAGKAVAEELSGLVMSVNGMADPPKLDGATLALVKQALVLRVEEADAALRAAGAERGAADADAGTKRRLLAGEFDGRCPVLGSPCPARAHVEAEGARAGGAFEAASQRLVGAGRAYDEARRGQAEAAGKLARLEGGAARLYGLRQEAARLKASHDRWQALSEASQGVAGAAMMAEGRGLLRDAEARVAVLVGARVAAAEARVKRDAARAEAESLERAVRTAAAATAIFGKGGAQRRLAESALEEVESLANAQLAECEIPLSVRVQWAREGSGVAATCSACGEPFPRSEKVKVCARCGADRGPNVVHSLTIEPSAQSGGARDLAGIFVQLAAAAWLVEDRGAEWGTALLDEPTATLDSMNRRSLSAHLPQILRRVGCEQALVISHSSDALQGLPGRIEVVSDGTWSTARVTA